MIERIRIRPIFRIFTAILAIFSAIGLVFGIMYHIDAHITAAEYKERLANFEPLEESGNPKIDSNIKRMNAMQIESIKLSIDMYEYVKKRFLGINLFLILFSSFFSWVTLKGDVPKFLSIMNWKVF